MTWSSCELCRWKRHWSGPLDDVNIDTSERMADLSPSDSDQARSCIMHPTLLRYRRRTMSPMIRAMRAPHAQPAIRTTTDPKH
nr:hypothetical protein CFP56_01244 [Quercus suber]